MKNGVSPDSNYSSRLANFAARCGNTISSDVSLSLANFLFIFPPSRTVDSYPLLFHHHMEIVTLETERSGQRTLGEGIILRSHILEQNNITPLHVLIRRIMDLNIKAAKQVRKQKIKLTPRETAHSKVS